MDTLHQPPVSDPDPQAATPYFLRSAAVLEAVEAEKARRLGTAPAA